jgi:hypothetical protein
VTIFAIVLAAIAGGCGSAPVAAPGDSDIPPWKASASTIAVTAAPDAGGVLSFRNCPTLAEAQAALPSILEGPEANGVPYKSMVLQCSYRLPGFDATGRPAGVGMLVFDAMAEGRATWSWTLEDDWGQPTSVTGVGDEAFATRGTDRWDLWVGVGRFGIHVSHTSRDDLALESLAALARTAVVALARPPR